MATHRILLVDDDAPTRTLFARILTQAGHDVATAGSVPEAEALLAEEPPDLLITDVRLDSYNGLQLVAKVPAHCPAIAITGYLDSVIERDAQRLGAECLLKPIPSATLLATVERTLSQRVPRQMPDDRREARTELSAPLPITVPGASGHVLAVSAQGAHVQIDTMADVADPLTFTIPSAGAAISARVVWARRAGPSTMCGLRIASTSQDAWRAAIAAHQS